MARFLIMARDKTHPDPKKDKMCWKKGQIVCIMEDGHIWGAAERAPNFYWIDIPGVKAKDAKKYIEEDWVQDGLEEDGITPRLAPSSRRVWKFDVDSIPKPFSDKLPTGLIVNPTDGLETKADLQWAATRAFLKNTKTSLSETADLKASLVAVEPLPK